VYKDQTKRHSGLFAAEPDRPCIDSDVTRRSLPAGSLSIFVAD